MDKLKEQIEQHLLIRIEELKDKKMLDTVNAILETSFKDVMQRNNFRFSHYENFRDDLEELIDRGGRIFIARYMHKPVATIAMEIAEIDKWYCSGKIAKMCHLGVLPRYQEHGLGRRLLGTVLQEAAALELPLTFCTPERNVGTIRFYEKQGAKRVAFFRADDHYTVRFVFFNNKEITDAQCRTVYENSAFSCLMKNRNLPCEPADEGIVKKWKKDFAQYIENATDEEVSDMRKTFLRYGITPAEYKQYDFPNRERKEKAKYISKNTAATLRDKYRNANPGSKKADKDELASKGSSSKAMHRFANGYNGTVRMITINIDGNVQPAFALLNLNKTGEKEKKASKATCFADINIKTGKAVSPATLLTGSGSQGVELNRVTLPDWNDLVSDVTNAASPLRNGFMGWDAKYDGRKWIITNAVTNPSFVNIQLAKGRGIKLQLQKLLGEEIETKLQT